MCVCECVFLSMWAGMSSQLHVGAFCVYVCVCMFDLLQEWLPFVFVCASLTRTDNEHCDHRFVCRSFSVCVWPVCARATSVAAGRSPEPPSPTNKLCCFTAAAGQYRHDPAEPHLSTR